MGSIVTIHSFRRGVGKTSLASSLSVLLARQGRRVALVDTDFQSPAVQLFFGLLDEEIPHPFNDYLKGRCDILSTSHDVTPKMIPNTRGKLFVLPAAGKISDIMQGIQISANIDHFVTGLEKMEKELSLDLILVDSPAGLSDNALQTIAVSSAVVLVLRADKQDFQGTAVAVDTIRQLKQAPSIYLVLNDAPESFDLEDARRELEETYCCTESLILKHSEELLALSSGFPFVIKYPTDPLTDQINRLAKQLSD